MTDMHVHTAFCDGENTPAEMAQAATSYGVSRLGIVAHSFVPFEPECCIAPKKEREFIGEVNALKREYSKKAEILCGLELDSFSKEQDVGGYDFVIGAVHYFAPDRSYAVDASEQIFVSAVQKLYNGDYVMAAKSYFDAVTKVCSRAEVDIVAHFDLIAKYNEGNKYFDECDSRYLEAAFGAADKLLERGKTFEVNYGAVLRGLRKYPYPGSVILDYIAKNGGKFVFSSDAHSVAALMRAADKNKV